MRRIDLLSVLLLIASAGLVGTLAVKGKLGWAWDALAVYRDGGTTSTIEHTMEQQAVAILQRGGSPDEARELLERSLAIDPYSSAVHKLGDALAAAGDLEGARRQYERYLELDPAYLPSYLQLIDVYEKLGLPEERAALIQRGIDHYAAWVDEFRPQPDDDAHGTANEKAYGLHNAYREGLEVLRRLQSPAEPTGPTGPTGP